MDEPVVFPLAPCPSVFEHLGRACELAEGHEGLHWAGLVMWGTYERALDTEVGYDPLPASAEGEQSDGAGEAAPPEVGAFGCYRCGHEGSADDPCDDEECARLGPLPWSERSDGSPPHPAQSATGDGAGEADCRGQGVVDKAGERGDSPATPLDGAGGGDVA